MRRDPRLSQLTLSSVDAMNSHHGAVVHTRAALDETLAAGLSFVSKARQLDKQMADIELIGTQLSEIDRALSGLETAFREQGGAC